MKRGVVAGAVAVCILAAGAVGAWWWLNRAPSAEDVARSYLAALAEGDATAALALTGADDAQRADALAAYGEAVHITAPRIVSADSKDGAATVEAAYRLDGEEVPVTLRLHEQKSGWRLIDALGSVTATTTPATRVRIGGLEAPGAGGEVALLPGRYDVVPLPEEVLTGAVTVDVAPGSQETAAVTASFAPAAAGIAQSQLDAYAAGCTAPGTTVPAHCGLRIPWGADLIAVDSIAYRVERTPQVALSADAASFSATGGVVVATVKGPSRKGGEGEFTYRAEDWALYGSISFADGRMVLAVR